MPVVQLEARLSCPHCGVVTTAIMPVTYCQYFYDCLNCGAVMRPKRGDCCVYCSYGDTPCPPIQADRESGAEDSCGCVSVRKGRAT